jgi:hypothetical protein
LAAFEDCLVVVGGWVPDLLLAQADEPHVGSIEEHLKISFGVCEMWMWHSSASP